MFIASKEFEANNLLIGNVKVDKNILSYVNDYIPLTIKNFDMESLSCDLKNTLSINEYDIMFESNFNYFLIRKQASENPLNEHFM